jgi:hypothetical protein
VVAHAVHVHNLDLTLELALDARDFRDIRNSARSRTARLLHYCVAVAVADADDEGLIWPGHRGFVPTQSSVTAVQPVR